MIEQGVEILNCSINSWFICFTECSISQPSVSLICICIRLAFDLAGSRCSVRPVHPCFRVRKHLFAQETPVRTSWTPFTGEESARNTWKPVLSALDPHILILIPLETDPPYRTHKSPLYLFLSFIFSSSFPPPPPPLRLRLRRRSWNDFVLFFLLTYMYNYAR